MMALFKLQPAAARPLLVRSVIARVGGRTLSTALAEHDEVDAAALRHSADKMLDYYVGHQKEDGSLEGFDDASHYV